MTWVTGQLLFASQLTAALNAKLDAGTVSSYSATLLAGTTQSSWFSALGLPSAAPGAANGLATLDSGAHVPVAQLPASVVGALNYQGTWNATTNSPALASGVGTKGFYYKVATGGTTSIDGNASWSIGDFIAFNGTTWDKIQSSGNVTIPSSNITDSTPIGRALLTAASIPAQRVALRIDQVQNVVDTDQTISLSMQSVSWTSLTAPRVGSLPAASTLNAGQLIYIYDESGNCSNTNTITLNANGADTINGLSSYTLRSAFAAVIVGRASSTKLTAMPLTPDTVGFRNRLINGDMKVDQRNSGASQTFTAGAALAYSVDRWYGYCTGANVTGQQIAGSAPDLNLYRFTGAASVTAIGFGQRIEAINCFDLAGVSAVLSVALANSLLTTVTWTAYYATTTDTFGTLASPTKTQIATGTFTVTSTLTKYSVVIAIPSAATTGIEVLFTVGAQTSGTWTTGNAQLEPGSVRTAFERLPAGVSLPLCQRYFWKTNSTFTSAYNPAGGGVGYNSIIQFPVTMRVAPTASATFSGSNNCTPTVSATSSQWATITLTSTAGGLMFSNYSSGNTFGAEL